MTKTSAFFNLLVIRSENIDRAVKFYEAIGLTFDKHSHGKGPEHYACEKNGLVFEIYPLSSKQPTTIGIRLGFAVNDVDILIETLPQIGAAIISSPKDSEWGRRAVVKDLDGHTVELVEGTKKEIL
ncbi:VOC family protein [Akkermansiaceae bacterium]|jgi:predicted enzyme related to lactoylglutathione lyase|nr:VOC family protein [Akkermansiaceae bacterium]